MNWGTDRVMAQTRERLAALGWRWCEPATLWDAAGEPARLLAANPEVTALSGTAVRSERFAPTNA